MRLQTSIEDSIEEINRDNQEFDNNEIIQIKFLKSFVKKGCNQVVDSNNLDCKNLIKALRFAYIPTTKYHQRDVVLALEMVDYDNEIILDRISKNDIDMLRACRSIRINGGVGHETFIKKVIFAWHKGENVVMAKLSVSNFISTTVDAEE